ncbi:MAG: DUF882 domain-containing protein [Deltaproteobacteria bacterium]|nr:DUF882 domain-containing protein [Deltaproteobacteria bacterium]
MKTFVVLGLLVGSIPAQAWGGTIPGGNESSTRSSQAIPARPAASVATPSSKQAARPSRNIPPYTLSLYNVNTDERITRMPVFHTEPAKPGRLFVNSDARQKLEHMLRDHHTDKVRRGMPDALWFYLYLLAYHFDGPIHVVSGYRSRDRLSSRHRQGSAVDFFIPGADMAKVWQYAKSRFTDRGVGLGFYPRSGFVHLDIRKLSYYWIDDSGQGQRPRFRAGVRQPTQQWQRALQEPAAAQH